MKFENTTVHITVTKEQLLYCFMAETTEEFDRRMEQLANDMQQKIEVELFNELMKEEIQMDDYISREAVMQKFLRRGDGYINMQTMCDMINEIPAADVQPVKHGRWIARGDDRWLCSNCKENIIFSMHESDRIEKERYCCKCGARMDR